jgi:glycosyltransferase involved in cell wall biosynthesis
MEWPESHERRLLSVAHGVRLQLPAARFVTWATGDRADRLVARSAAFGLADRLHVLPRGEDLPRVLSALNVFCYLADEQTRPLPLIEAMAVQAPVVASAGRQTASLVQSDCNGFCLDADDLPSFAAHVVRLINDPRLARRLGECGRQHVVKYRSLEAMVRRYEQLIGQTYQRKRSGPGTTQPEPLRDTVEFCGASS